MWKAFADYHTHTVYSHGGGTIRDNAKKAKERGLEELGIADHGPANWGHIATTGLDAFDKIIKETKEVQREFSELKILAATEANLNSFQGDLDIPLGMQKKLDMVLAGFHTTIYPKSFEDGFQFASQRVLSFVSPDIKRKARAANTKAMVEAVYKNEIDIITHPGLKISIDTHELARACVQNHTALEINSKHGIKSIEFIKAAAREGVKFAIGSDAHQPERVGQLEAGIKSAQMAGLNVDQLMNVREI